MAAARATRENAPPAASSRRILARSAMVLRSRKPGKAGPPAFNGVAHLDVAHAGNFSSIEVAHPASRIALSVLSAGIRYIGWSQATL